MSYNREEDINIAFSGNHTFITNYPHPFPLAQTTHAPSNAVSHALPVCYEKKVSLSGENLSAKQRSCEQGCSL